MKQDEKLVSESDQNSKKSEEPKATEQNKSTTSDENSAEV